MRVYEVLRGNDLFATLYQVQQQGKRFSWSTEQQSIAGEPLISAIQPEPVKFINYGKR